MEHTKACDWSKEVLQEEDAHSITSPDLTARTFEDTDSRLITGLIDAMGTLTTSVKEQGEQPWPERAAPVIGKELEQTIQRASNRRSDLGRLLCPCVHGAAGSMRLIPASQAPPVTLGPPPWRLVRLVVRRGSLDLSSPLSLSPPSRRPPIRVVRGAG